jgi:hypothetical protein
MPILAALEFSTVGKQWFARFAFFTAMFETVTMIITRGHYTIDLIFGMITAHYIYRLVCDYIHIIDTHPKMTMESLRRSDSVSTIASSGSSSN